MSKKNKVIRDLLSLDKEYFYSYKYIKYEDYELIKKFIKELCSSDYFAIKLYGDYNFLYYIEQENISIEKKRILIPVRKENIKILNEEVHSFNLFFYKNISILKKNNGNKIHSSFHTLYEKWIDKDLIFLKLNNTKNIKENFYLNNKLLNTINRIK